MSRDNTSQAPVHEEVYPGTPKSLLMLVKIMGVIMVLLFLGLIAGIIWKATNRTTPPITTDVTMELGLDPATIRQMALDGNTLAITTDKDLLVIDLKLRKVILRSSKP
jgi:hypothetical protein